MIHIQSYLGGVAVDIAVFRTNGRARWKWWGLRRDGVAMREMRGREWGFKSMVVAPGCWRDYVPGGGGVWVLFGHCGGGIPSTINDRIGITQLSARRREC